MNNNVKRKHPVNQKEQGVSNRFDTNLLLDNSPIVSVEEYGDESEILQYKIKADGVKNIAVVASFGAGKSSAIETYLHIHRPNKKRLFHRKKTKPNDTYTRISLASFNDTEYKDSDVERSILQQLLYSQPKSKLPNSRVERTTTTSKWLTTLLAFIVLTLASSILLFSLQMGKVFLYEKTYLNWVFLGLAGASFFALTWILLHFRKLSRVKYKDFELEIKQKDDVKTHSGQSLINKFVDEVLYFFESTKIDLVIFEDLDRLEYKIEEWTKGEDGKPKLNMKIMDRSSAILVKLRELNTLINNSQQCKRKITFLYAIKDDMLKKQEERAKFFEFILPIIPILNPVTKANKMREEHERMVKKELGMAEGDKLDYRKMESSTLKLDSEFIGAISTYIPNMRTLKNAFNEYIISHGRIFRRTVEGRLSNENLFALSLYKNLYPYDYAKLEQGTGIIPIIMNKSHLIVDEVKSSKEKIKELQELLTKADNDHLKNFEELREIFKARVPGITQLVVNGQWVAINNVNTFNGIELGVTQYQHQRQGYGGYSAALPTNLTLPNGDSFLEREQILVVKTKEGKEQIAKLIEKENQSIVRYEAMTLNELIKLKGVDFHFQVVGEKETTKVYLAELRNVAVDNEEDNRLRTFNKDSKQLGYLKFLIQNNHIDEKYMEYTSSYESKMLSAFDEGFIRKVQQGEQDYNHKIDNPGNVIDRIRESSFSEPAILNNTILANLKIIKDQKKNNKYKNIKSLLNTETAKEAIKTFIRSNDENQVVEFLIDIVDGNTSVCGRLLSDGEFASDKKDLVIWALIESTSKYAEHNVDGKLSSHIEESENYEQVLGKADSKKVKAFLTQIKPRIGKLQNTENEITKYAIENSMYQINTDNLEKVLGITDANSDFYKKNYAFISSNAKVKAYIDANPNEYVKNIFASVPDSRAPNGEENSTVAVDFLNREGLTNLQQFQIIRKYPFIVDKIDEYESGLHSVLLEFDRVKPTWENILFAYLNDAGFNDIIKNFILRHADDVEGDFECTTEKTESGNGADETLTKDVCESIFVGLANAVYTNDELLNLKKVAAKINAKYALDESYDNDEGLPVFIAEGNIDYDSEALQYLMSKPKSLKAYVVKFIVEVKRDFDEFFADVDANALRALLLSDAIDGELQQKLITVFGDRVVVDGSVVDYFNMIRSKRMSIPTVLLSKFANSNLSKSDKQDLATWVSDREQNTQLFNNALSTIMPELRQMDRELKIEIDSEKEEILLRIYAAAAGLAVSKRKNKVTLRAS